MRPKVVQCPPHPANETVVATLESYLVKAKAGELRAVLLVGIVHDGDGEGSVFELSCGKRVWRDAMLGAIERGKFTALSDWT